MVEVGAASEAMGARALGKAAGENFPVALRLLGPSRRRVVHAFYVIARAADDVADAPGLTSAEKLALLDEVERGLATGAFAQPVLQGAGGRLDGEAKAYLRQMLRAFRADAVNAPVRTPDDLLAYCRDSADPVGRFLLHLHGEDPRARAPADALCSALQILNHLQDAGDDWRRLKRLYLPTSWLDAAGAEAAMLAAAASPPPLLRVLRRANALAGDLVVRAEPLPRLVRSPGLRAQAAATVAVARRLQARLAREDPLAARVALSRSDKAVALLRGLGALVAAPA